MLTTSKFIALTFLTIFSTSAHDVGAHESHDIGDREFIAEGRCIGSEKPTESTKSSDKLYLLSAGGERVGEENEYVLNADLRLASLVDGHPEMIDSEKTQTLLSLPDFQSKLKLQSSLGGMAQAASEFFRVPNPNDPSIKIVLNKLCFEFTNQGLILNITTKKAYSSATVPGFKVGLWYEWKINVEEFFVGEIEKIVKGKKFNLKLHARSENFKVEEFRTGIDVNNDNIVDTGEIFDVQPFFKDGSVNFLYSVFSANNTDCIDIDIAVKGNISAITSGGKFQAIDSAKAVAFSTTLSTLSDRENGIQFCAGSCSGYMLAASNGG